MGRRHPRPGAARNKNVVFDSAGITDIKGGRIDPRIVAVLTKLSQDHKLTISATESDHPKFTTGGSVSNHHLGRRRRHRGDRRRARQRRRTSTRARWPRTLAELDPSIRPSEIGSPFAIAGPAYFTDAAHQNHIHVGFETEISPDFKPPADARRAPATAPAAAPAAPRPRGWHRWPASPRRRRGRGPGAGRRPRAGARLRPVRRDRPARGGQGRVRGRRAPGRTRRRSIRSRATRRAARAGRGPARPAPGAAPAADVAAGAVDVSAVSDAYPGDDATKEQLAAWMARRREARPPARAAPSWPRSSNRGEEPQLRRRRPVGFFQMRVGTGTRATTPATPTTPKSRSSGSSTRPSRQEATHRRGQSVTDPKQFGEWIADVERPAEQYRGRYQLRLDEANGLLAKLGAGAAAPEAAVQAARRPWRRGRRAAYRSRPPRRRRRQPARRGGAEVRGVASAGCTRSAGPTAARRSTSTSRRRAWRRGTRGARRSSPGRWSRPGTRCRAAAGPPSRPGCERRAGQQRPARS